MNEIELINKRAKIIELQQLSCDLENTVEKLREVLNPDKHESLIRGFESIMEDGRKCLRFILKVLESEMNKGSENKNEFTF